MKVSTLAAKLGLPKEADQATCLAKIKEMQQDARPGASLDEARAAVARMQLKFGLEPDPEALERHLLAKPLTQDRYTLNGAVLTAEELQTAAEAAYEDEHALDVDIDPIQGEEIDRAARELCASRHIWEPTAAQYLSACLEVGAQ